MERLEALETSSSNSQMGFGTNNGFTPPNDVSRLDNRMKALEQEVARSRQADGEAVAFFNLGFRSKKESDA